MNKTTSYWFHHEQVNCQPETPSYSAPMLVAEGGQLVVKQGTKHE